MIIEDNKQKFYKNINNYIYTEYQVIYRHGEQKQHSKWRPCVLRPSINHPYLPTTADILKQYPRSELFFGQYCFADPTTDFSKDKAHQYYKYADFIMESDHTQAIEYSRTVVDFIIEELNIPTDAISLECSGSRSVHIVVSGVAFGIKPSIELHRIQEEMAKMIMEATGTVFDKSIYKPRRVFRASGSYRPDKGTYKTVLTMEEFRTLTWEQILELCKSRRPEPVRFYSEPSPRAAEFYEEARTRVIKQNEDRSKLKQTSNISNKEVVKHFSQSITTHKSKYHSIPPCIQHIMKYGTSEELRHETCLFHATFCYSAGYSIEEAFEQISLWHSTIPHSRYLREEREYKLQTQLKSIYLDGTYSFYCRSYALKLHIPCHKNCPLWTKMSKLRAIEPALTTDTSYTSLDEARTHIRSAMERKDTVVRTPPGSGKTVAALEYCNRMKQEHPGHQYVYATARINHLDELQEKGLLPATNWQIIRARIAMTEPHGNCYKAEEINEYIKIRKYGYITNNICNQVDCSYWKECSSSQDMYKGQWQTSKNMAMTHQMLSLTSHRIANATKIVIDEIPFKSFIEQVVVQDYLIYEARQYYKKRWPTEKGPKFLFIALGYLIDEIKRNDKEIYLTGKDFLEALEVQIKKYSSALSLDDIKNTKAPQESEKFIWRLDFYQLLKEEIQKYHIDRDYNSQIHLRYYAERRNINFSFYLIRTMKAITTEGIIGLDATSDRLLWEKILGRPMEEVSINIKYPEGTRIVQVYSGRYGKNYQFQKPQLMAKLKELTTLLGEDTYVAGWKDLREELGVEEERYGHYFGTRGSNRFESYQKALINGTPNIRPDGLKEEVLTIFKDEAPIDFSVQDVDCRYNTNINGKDFSIPVPTALDPRYQAVWSYYREAEAFQNAHRVRPLLAPKTIYIIGNIPLEGLPPTELIGLDKLLSQLKYKTAETSYYVIVLIKEQIWWMMKYKQIVENILINDHHKGEAIPDADSGSFKSATAYRDKVIRSDAHTHTMLAYYIAVADQKLIQSYQGKDLSSISIQTWQRLFNKFCTRYELTGHKVTILPPGKKAVNLNVYSSFSNNGVTSSIVLEEYIKFNSLSSI